MIEDHLPQIITLRSLALSRGPALLGDCLEAPSPPLPLPSCTSQPLFPTLRIKLDQVLRNHTVSVVR